MTSGGSPPIALAFDTAGLACSVVVAIGDRMLNAEHKENMHGQAEALLPMVDSAMRNAGLAPRALDLVAVTVGPGSFTGIRVGLAGARGIALATGARLIGVTSFEAVAAAVVRRDSDRDRFLLVALESRRSDLYVQFFDPRCDPIGGPAAIMPSDLGGAVNATIGAAPLSVAGDAAQRAALALAERPDMPILTETASGAVGALRAALRALQVGGESDSARPLYLRPPDVTLSSLRREADRDIA
jgi:tRNA threonylcarbamoyladenosine biosynthesis protein TsaB